MLAFGVRLALGSLGSRSYSLQWEAKTNFLSQYLNNKSYLLLGVFRTNGSYFKFAPTYRRECSWYHQSVTAGSRDQLTTHAQFSPSCIYRIRDSGIAACHDTCFVQKVSRSRYTRGWFSRRTSDLNSDRLSRPLVLTRGVGLKASNIVTTEGALPHSILSVYLLATLGQNQTSKSKSRSNSAVARVPPAPLQVSMPMLIGKLRIDLS